jgi:hypothetical protein
MANSYKIKILSCILIIWFIMSVFNVFYNLLKSVSEVKIWFPLTDYEKRKMIFGDFYPFLSFVSANSAKNSNMLIYSKDVKSFYLSIYYLYPRAITIVDNKNDLNSKLSNGEFKYVAIYKNSYKPIAYRLSATLPGIGELYLK